MKVKVVTAYVPLPVLHVSREKYKSLGNRLVDAIPDNIFVFDDYGIEDCWAYSVRSTPPAQAVPSDRYASPADFVLSNIVQHQRTTWAMLAAVKEPDVDVWVWLDYGILKQGDFTGKPVTAKHVAEFVKRVATRPSLLDIPFPGIWPRGPISDTGDNWRFCGSTHIWRKAWLPLIDKAYRRECKLFIERTNTVPHDLPIWAHTELSSGLPFRWYAANHDATQLTNFPAG